MKSLMEERIAISKRIRELRRAHKYSQAYVAGKLFISQAAYSLIENGQNAISSVHLLRLSKLYRRPADYLLTGNKNFISMTWENGFMPLINAKAHAGFLKNAHEEKVMEDFEYYRIPGYNPTKDSMLIEIEGESMQPAIMSGDVLVCQRQKNLEYVLDGSVVILVTQGELLTTRLFRHEDERFFRMESDNPGEDDKKKIKKTAIIKLFMVIGKVSNVLIPHKELAFKGKLKSLEESVNSLNKQVYKLEKFVNFR